MTRKELITRLQDIEWEDFEVKESAFELPKKIWETVSAFSNTGGGWIILGVTQKGKKFEITGIIHPEKVEQDFCTTLRADKFNVRIRPVCKQYSFEDKIILGFYIPVSEKKPVYFNTPVNTFLRTASGDQQATQEEIDSMYRDQAFGTQTQRTIPNTSVRQIHTQSFKQYREYLKRLEPGHAYNRLTDFEFMNKLRILANGKLTYGGLFFLGINDAIQETLADFRIDYLEIPGTSYADAKNRYTFRIDEQENLWQYYFALMDRLRQKVDLPFQLTDEGFASNDYPYVAALREALINMLMHADYFSAAKPRIRVFDDRIEFFNPGALPQPLKKIRSGDISLPRNPIIAKFFRIAKLAENAGYGFDKMETGWISYTNTLPLFEQGQDYTKVVFLTSQPDQKGGAISGAISGAILSAKQKEVYRIVKQNPRIGYREVAQILNISPSAVQKHLDTLKNKGVIEREGGTRGFWKILVGFD